MKKALLYSAMVSALCTGLCVSSPAMAGGGGSNCVKLSVQATCSNNTVYASGKLTNCGSGADTFNVTETITDANGGLFSSGSGSVSLKAGKSVTVPVSEAIPSDTVPGLYLLTVSAKATKGTGFASQQLTLALPCP